MHLAEVFFIQNNMILFLFSVPYICHFITAASHLISEQHNSSVKIALYHTSCLILRNSEIPRRGLSICQRAWRQQWNIKLGIFRVNSMSCWSSSFWRVLFQDFSQLFPLAWCAGLDFFIVLWQLWAHTEVFKTVLGCLI